MTKPDITEVFGDETKCEERLDPLWKLADEIGCYPASTADVFAFFAKAADSMFQWSCWRTGFVAAWCQMLP